MKICVLGDSHTACIKRAWDEKKLYYPNVDLTFFAAARDGLSRLAPKEKFLVPTTDALRANLKHTSGGHDRIDLSLFDHVLLVGLITFYPTIEHCASLEIARKIALYQMKDTLGHILLKRIRRIDEDIPLWLMHRPLVADETGITSGSKIFEYSHIVEFLNAQFFANYKCVMLQQPAETIINNSYTKAEYSIDSERLDIGSESDLKHSAADNIHMNSRFGLICLENHLNKIACHSAAQAKRG